MGCGASKGVGAVLKDGIDRCVLRGCATSIHEFSRELVDIVHLELAVAKKMLLMDRRTLSDSKKNYKQSMAWRRGRWRRYV